MTLNPHLRIALLAAVAVFAAGCAHRATAPVPPTPPPASTAAAASAANADPDAAAMPAAPGKAATVEVCGGCHTLARVVRQHQTKQQWQATIVQMKHNGLFASPAELTQILNYLTAHYGPRTGAAGAASGGA